MKRAVILMLPALLLGCAASTESTAIADPVANLPPSLLQACAPNLPKWPEGDLTQAQLETAALKDGKVYRECAGRHNALVGILTHVDTDKP